MIEQTTWGKKIIVNVHLLIAINGANVALVYYSIELKVVYQAVFLLRKLKKPEIGMWIILLGILVFLSKKVIKGGC